MEGCLKMKKISLMITVLLIVLLAAGCVPTERSDMEIGPDLSGKGNIGIDYVQLGNDAMDAFDDVEPYSFVSAVGIGSSEDGKTITANIAAEEDVEACRAFAAALLKNIADSAVTQDASYTASTSTDFGSFWETHSADCRFYNSEDFDPENMEGAVPFYEYSLAAGERSDLDPDTEAYEAEYHRQIELLQRNDGAR